MKKKKIRVMQEGEETLLVQNSKMLQELSFPVMLATPTLSNVTLLIHCVYTNNTNKLF
jgi:hypothetical protein